jgi:hypothetical protein
LARPTTYATQICIALTVLAAVGIALGFATGEVMYPIVFLAPTVAYEAYRTEGRSTRWASWTLAALMVALIVVAAMGIEYDLRELFGDEIVYSGDESIPLGDVNVVFPTAMAILAAVLWGRTRGVYTRWLAGIIFVTALVVTHLTTPDTLGEVLSVVG